MRIAYVFLIGFAASMLIQLVYRFEPNRWLAGILASLVFLVSALAILSRLSGDGDQHERGGVASKPSPAEAADTASTQKAKPWARDHDWGSPGQP